MPRLIYYGHSCFLTQDEQTRLIFDPYLTGNTNIQVDIERIKQAKVKAIGLKAVILNYNETLEY